MAQFFIRIRSAINFNDQYIRHFNNEGELSVLDPNSRDFIFEMIEVGNSQVRFQSTNQNIRPPMFLRHQNFRVLLQADTQDPQFQADSTFTRVQPMWANGNFVSYQAINFNRFIRHIDFHVFIDEMNDDQGKQDATFAEETVGVLPGSSTL